MLNCLAKFTLSKSVANSLVNVFVPNGMHFIAVTHTDENYFGINFS